LRKRDMIPYFIIGPSRAGSAWLCSMLASTGVAGRPRDIIDSKHPWPEWELCRGENGVIGARPSWRAASKIIGKMSPHDFKQLKIISIRRDDIWLQAVSLYRAEQSGLWHKYRGDKTGKMDGIAFDADAIRSVHKSLLYEYRACRKFFAKIGKVPMTISYEYVCEDPVRATMEVLGFLGIEYSGEVDTGATIKMRDETSEEWAARLSSGK
ncbi:MAG TPA: Stf0 family sulfotransferase, partial [Anaerolineae bacterium]|nr:Stf0 family sulfotransferase [Anaerolineae bacterium]